MTEEEKKHLHDISVYSEEQVSEQIKRLTRSFTYVGGYTNSNGYVNIRCDNCGSISKASMCSIRHKHNKVCKVCANESKNNKKKENDLSSFLLLINKETETNQHKLAKETKCIVCGNMFLTTKERQCCCSKECSKKHSNTLCSQKKRKRIKKEQMIDTTIELKALYERDDGVCHICGQLCDYNDYSIRSDAFIAGDTYPSIDHVIPVSKGGLHSWSNVKLAHRRCNTIKSNKTYPSP